MVTDMIKYRNDSKYREKCLQYNKNYRNTKNGRLKHNEGNKTYAHSKKGQITNIKRNNKWNFLHSPINHLKQRHELIMENCAICNSNKDIQFHHPNKKLPLHVYFLCAKCHIEQHWGK